MHICGFVCCRQVAKLKGAFQKCIREAEALKLELGRAEQTLHAATGVSKTLSAAWQCMSPQRSARVRPK